MSVYHLDLFIGPTSKHMSMRNTAGDKYYHRPTDISANIATCLQSCNDMQICKESREESSNGSDPANSEESTENTGLIVGVIAGVFILGGVIGGTIYHRKSKKAKVAAGGGKGKSGYNSYRVEVKQKNTDNVSVSSRFFVCASWVLAHFFAFVPPEWRRVFCSGVIWPASGFLD